MEQIEWSEGILDTMLTTPSQRLIRDMQKIRGDIMVLGAGGKMGPDICILAKKASEAAGISRKIYAVSRFSDPAAEARLRSQGVTTISCDLLALGALAALPECGNIIFMAGMKFNSRGNEPRVWAMNTWLPCNTAQRFPKSRFVVFSSGNLYPKVSPASGGASEDTPLLPIGDYCMSCQGRERMFEYAAQSQGTPVALMRLNYAIDLRYGVLHDIAQTILRGEPLDLGAMPCFNCIWQRDGNEAAIRLLTLASPEVYVCNVTGPETAGVRRVGQELGRLLGKPVSFRGEEAPTAYLNNASSMCRILGYPSVSLDTLIQWQAQWLLSGGRSLGKPTHFEERNGNY